MYFDDVVGGGGNGALASLDATGGSIVLNGGSVDTVGKQTYHGAVALNNSATLTGKGMTFDGTVDGAGSSPFLTIHAGSGAVSFDGAVGSTSALGALNIDGTGANTFGSTVRATSLITGTGPVTLGGDVTTTGAQTYHGATTLRANVTLLAGTHTVTFDDSIDSDSGGPYILAIGDGSTATNASFGAALGATHGLDALSVQGTTLLAGDVTTTGLQAYNGAVTLDGSSSGNSISLTASDITFGGTVDSASGLTDPQSLTLHLNGPVATRFNGAVGSSGALGALKIIDTGSSQTQFYGTVQAASLTVSGDALVSADVTTSGDQTYGGDVQLDNVSLTSNGGDIEFQGAVSSPAMTPALTIDAGSGAVKFDSAVQVLGPGATLDVTGKGGISQFASSVISVSYTASFDAGSTGAITLAGANQFEAAVNLAGAAAQITNAALLTLGAVDVASLQAKAGGAITQTSDGVAVAGTSSFDAGAHAITLANSNNHFGGAVSLTGGTTTVTNGSALTLGTLNTGKFTVTSGGALDLGSGTVGGDLLADSSSNNGAITQDTTSGKALTVTGTSSLNAGTGAITLANTGNDFTGAVTAIGTGISITDTNDLDVTQLTDGANGAVSLIAGGALTLPTGSINTGTADLTLAANGGALTSPGALSGANMSLTGSDQMILQDAVTATGTLTLISTHGAVEQQAASAITAATLTGGSSGATNLSGFNAVANLGNFTADDFSLTNAQALTVTAGKSVDGGTGGTALTTIFGDLAINGTVGNTGGATTLTSAAGAINEGANGIVKANTLTGSSVDDTTLDGANLIGTLGAFSARNFSLTSAQPLSVLNAPSTTGGTGNISLTTTIGNKLNVATALAGGEITLDAGSDLSLTHGVHGSALDLAAHGDLAINAALNSGTGTTTLTQTGAGDIREGASGVVTANTLTGSSNGATVLSGANAIASLGNFTAKGFSLTNAQALTVTAGASVDGGTGGMALATTAGSLVINGNVGGAGVNLQSAGAIDISGGAAVSSTKVVSLHATNGMSLDGNVAANGDASLNAGGTMLLNGSLAAANIHVQSGTLQVGSGGTTGSITGNVTDNGTLAFNRSDAASYGGVFSGTGALTKLGAGTLTLTGANTYSGGTTISAGALQGDATSLQGAITDNAALTFNQAGDGTFAGAISGTGSLTKSGAGTLILNGVNPLGGSVSVQAGTLIVGDDGHADATLDGMISINSGATLGGFGTVGGLDLSGTLAPGHSIGTLHVSGDATFEKGSVYTVEATPDGHSDQLAVAGKANIRGGSAMVLAQAGDWAPQTSYTILTAGGGISGQFDSVSSSLAFLTPTLNYAANSLSLVLKRNNLNFTTVAQNGNQSAVAGATNGLSSGNPVYDVLVKLDAPTARAAFAQLSGEIHADVQRAQLDASRYVLEGMNRRLTSAADSGSSVWAYGWGHWGDADGDGNAARMKANGSGVLVGTDTVVSGGSTRIGVLLGDSQTSLNTPEGFSSAHLRSTWLGLYFGTRTGALRVRGGLTRAHVNSTSTRYVQIPGLKQTLRAHGVGHTLQAYAEVGWAIQAVAGKLEPYLDVAGVRVSMGLHHEHGGSAALAVQGTHRDLGLGILGMRGSWHLGNANSPVALQAGLGWRHAFGSQAADTSALLRLSGSDAFTVYGLPIARNAAAVDLGVRFDIGAHTHVTASYDGQFASDSRDQGARLRVAYAF